ncbi:MAG: TetR/AcrR family transcriptional regulator [Propionibacteriaceae bacterium]|nr:TetR/AcrR family transcriptional regulator [Propionibacteriaceae bacterium]
MRRRRRTATEVEAAIRAAVLAELAEGGYGAVTFEGIARRVGTSKPVLYRRYPDRASMIFDAIRSQGPSRRLQESTGSLRDDLFALMSVAHDETDQLRAGAYRALIGEAREDTLAQAAEMVLDVHSRIQDVVLRPARERGELGPEPLDPEVVLTPLRLGRDRLVLGPLTAGHVADIIDKVALPLYRVASGLPSTRASSGGND